MKKENLWKALFTLLGIVLISLAIWFPGRKIFIKDKEIFKEIDLSSFKGEIYPINELELYPIELKKSKERINNLSEFSKSCMLEYDTINNYISIIIPDVTTFGKYKIIKNYIGGYDVMKYYTSTKINNDIFVFSEARGITVGYRIIFFLILLFGGFFVLIFTWQ
jgi:hypothetical protein